MPFKPKSTSAQRTKERRSAYNRERGSSAANGYGGKAWQSLRKSVFLRDGYRCVVCKKFVGLERGDAHCDHIIPKAAGGSDDLTNCQTICVRCHAAKTVRESR